MRNYFTFNSVDSRDFGVYISGQGSFSSPPRSLNMVKIPGRNGDLILSDNRFENGTLTYPAFIYRNFDENFTRLKNWLSSSSTYGRITDSYHPDEYRYGIITSGFEPQVTRMNNAASFDISFNVKPQRFLLSGERPWITEYVSGAAQGVYFVATTSETAYPQYPHIPSTVENAFFPLIRIYGNGSVIFFRFDGSSYNARVTVRVTNSTNYIDFDGETLTFTASAGNTNASVSITYSYGYTGNIAVNGFSHTVEYGSNNRETLISVSGYATDTHDEGFYAEIYPRWWVL